MEKEKGIHNLSDIFFLYQIITYLCILVTGECLMTNAHIICHAWVE